MEIRDFVAHQTARDEVLRDIAAKIRPLPHDVAPTAVFMAQTRLRLLRLDAASAKTAPRQAA